jgi:hypothetical protein
MASFPSTSVAARQAHPASSFATTPIPIAQGLVAFEVGADGYLGRMFNSVNHNDGVDQQPLVVDLEGVSRCLDTIALRYISRIGTVKFGAFKVHHEIAFWSNLLTLIERQALDVDVVGVSIEPVVLLSASSRLLECFSTTLLSERWIVSTDTDWFSQRIKSKLRALATEANKPFDLGGDVDFSLVINLLKKIHDEWKRLLNHIKIRGGDETWRLPVADDRKSVLCYTTIRFGGTRAVCGIIEPPLTIHNYVNALALISFGNRKIAERRYSQRDTRLVITTGLSQDDAIHAVARNEG